MSTNDSKEHSTKISEVRKEIARKDYMKNLQDDNSKLQKQVRELQLKIKHLDKTISKLSSDSKKKKNMGKTAEEVSSEKFISETDALEFLMEYGGLSRFTLFQDQWHAAHKNAANQLFGFKCWEDAKATLKSKFCIALETPRIYKARRRGTLVMDKGTSDMEKALCIKMMDRMGLTKGRVALIFGVDERTVVKWRSEWCPKWGFIQKDSMGGRTNFSRSRPMINNTSTSHNSPKSKKIKVDKVNNKDPAAETLLRFQNTESEMKN